MSSSNKGGQQIIFEALSAHGADPAAAALLHRTTQAMACSAGSVLSTFIK